MKLSRASDLRHKKYRVFFNGDKFYFEVAVTGPVHVGDVAIGDIPQSKRTIRCELLTVDGDQPVSLVERNGQSIKVSSKPAGSGLVYTFQGTIHPDNQITGPIKAKVSLTSALNLGEHDRDVDETFVFYLRDPAPVVERVVVRRTGDPNGDVVYDSQTRRTKAITLQGGNYKAFVEVQFSDPMKPELTTITADAKQPYAKFILKDQTWDLDDSRVKGTLTIPGREIEHGAAIYYLRIGGTGQSGAELDANPLLDSRNGSGASDNSESGSNPAGNTQQDDWTHDDTSHFVLLGIDDFYEVKVSAKSDAFLVSPVGYNATMQFRPMEFTFKLVPDGKHYGAFLGRGNDLAQGLETFREGFETQIAAFESLIRGDQTRLKTLRGTDAAAAIEQQLRTNEQNVADLKLSIKQLSKFRPVADALVRISAGFKAYHFDPQIEGNVKAIFHGAKWTEDSKVTSRGWTTKTTLRFAAKRQSIDDFLFEDWRTDPTPSDTGASLPQDWRIKDFNDWSLIIWQVDRKDLQILNDFLSDFPSNEANNFESFEEFIKRTLSETIVSLWTYSTPESALPAEMRPPQVYRLVETIEPNSTQVVRAPHLFGDRFYRLQANMALFGRFPVIGEGTRETKEWDGSELKESTTTPLTLDDRSAGPRLSLEGADGASEGILFGADYYDLPKPKPRIGLTSGTFDIQSEWDSSRVLNAYDVVRSRQILEGSEFQRYQKREFSPEKTWTRHDEYRWRLARNGFPATGLIEQTNPESTIPVSPFDSSDSPSDPEDSDDRETATKPGSSKEPSGEESVEQDDESGKDEKPKAEQPDRGDGRTDPTKKPDNSGKSTPPTRASPGRADGETEVVATAIVQNGNGRAFIYLDDGSNGSFRSSDVAVYIDSDELPGGTGRQPDLRLSDVRDTLRVVSQGQHLVLTNDDTRTHTISGRSIKDTFTKELAPEATLTIRPKTDNLVSIKQGSIRIRDSQEPRRRVEVLIVPNRFHGVGQLQGAVLLNDVPPGTYAVRVKPIDPRLKPSSHEIIVEPNRVTQLYVELESR